MNDRPEEGKSAARTRRVVVHSERPVLRAGLARLIPEWSRDAEVRESGSR